MSPALATVLLVLLAGILFVLPLSPALIELRLKRDAHPLNVIQQYAGEIRHFSYGFRVYIEALLEPLQKCVVSRTALKGATPDGDEYLLLGHSSAALSSSVGKQIPNCSSIVAAGVDMVFPDGITFTKEVYAANKLVTGQNNVFRALLGENHIHLGRASTIIRWAHAVGALRAGPDCDLHGRISSDLEIQLESGCAFQRLNAPCIALGYSKEQMPDDVAETEEILLPLGRRLVDEDLEIKAGEVVTTNIVTRGRLHIRAGARVLGSVKSNQHMTLDANVSVAGSLISASTMHIGPDCRIAGPVIAEHGMAIEAGTRCGSIGTPTTVTAPTIEIAGGVMVFGSVWARTEGHVVPKR